MARRMGGIIINRGLPTAPLLAARLPATPLYARHPGEAGYTGKTCPNPNGSERHSEFGLPVLAGARRPDRLAGGGLVSRRAGIAPAGRWLGWLGTACNSRPGTLSICVTGLFYRDAQPDRV